MVSAVSVLFNEPKLLKSCRANGGSGILVGFSALQRAEIAEIIVVQNEHIHHHHRFSALQRAEIAEISDRLVALERALHGFSALQRAEIAEIWRVVFLYVLLITCFSALQRAEIAEIRRTQCGTASHPRFSRHHQDLVIYYFCTI